MCQSSQTAKARKEDLLLRIAEAGYGVGFGAKKHFATHDIIAKLPGFISILSVAVGVFSLFLEFLTAKCLSATFIVLGVWGSYISLHDRDKERYADIGSKLTGLFNQLKALYYQVKTADSHDLSEFESSLIQLEHEFISLAIDRQAVFSDWYAHYKFFWQHQIGWIEDQKRFRIFRDKIPLSFGVSLLLVMTLVVAYVFA